jgi:chemotaxis protein MotA
VVQWAQVVRVEGLLALEKHLVLTRDPFQKGGLQLLIDGADAAKLRDTLDVQIVGFETEQRQAARVWEAAGGYAPTLGILGAVIGLIHVMENLADPSKLGAGIAVAFVATIYGVGLANLLALPIANRLKRIVQIDGVRKAMILDGIVSMQQGVNPSFLRNRLAIYLQDHGQAQPA